MIEFLEKEHRNQPLGLAPTRHARVEVIVNANGDKNQLFELVVDLDNDKVVRKQHVEGKHSYIDSAYMKSVEAACLANEEVQAEIRTLDLPDGATVVVEPWAYATDGMNDMTERVTMVGNLSAWPHNVAPLVLTAVLLVLVLPPAARQPRCQLLCIPARRLCRGLRSPRGHQGLSPADQSARAHQQQ